MRKPCWSKVKVVAPVGTEFGIIRNDDELTLTFRRPGETWPYGQEPVGGLMIVQEGCTSYAVVNEDEEKSA